MTASSSDLEALWSRLATAGAGARRFVSLRVDDAGFLDVHVAVRSVDRAPCLLFDLADPESVGDVEFEVGGMRCSRGATDTGQSIVLSLEDGTRRDLFGTLTADLIAHAADLPSASALASVLIRLDAWRLFLRTVADGLKHSEVIGLIGELRILRELVQADSRLLFTWRAPDDAIHDLENRGHALEVKATLGAGSRITISGLDQLDEAGLEVLDLVHVRLYETPEGECIDDITGTIMAHLQMIRRDGFSKTRCSVADSAQTTGARGQESVRACSRLRRTASRLSFPGSSASTSHLGFPRCRTLSNLPPPPIWRCPGQK